MEHYRYRIIYCLAATALLLGTCVIARAQSQRPWEKLRAEQIAAARREGIPVTLAELRGKPVPADENAATYLTQLAAIDKASPLTGPEEDALDHLGAKAVTPGQIDAARKAFTAHLDRYRLIRLVAGCAAYDEDPGTLTVGELKVNDEFPQLASFRDCGRWLTYKAMLLAANGKPLESVKEVSLVFQTAHLATSRRTLVAYLVGKAVESMGFKTLRVILDRSSGDGGVAAAVENAIQTRPITQLSAIVRGEVANYLSNSASMRKDPQINLAANSDSRATKDPDYLRAVQQYHYPKDPKFATARMFDMNDAHYIAWMRRMIRFADLPYPQALAGIRSVEAEAKGLEMHPDYRLAAMVIETMEKLPALAARQIALAEAVRSYAAVLVWQSQHGKLPDSLAEAMSQPAIDPFDLKPMRYRIEGSGLVIYSVGETGKFDGGKPNVNIPVTEVAIWGK